MHYDFPVQWRGDARRAAAGSLVRQIGGRLPIPVARHFYRALACLPFVVPRRAVGGVPFHGAELRRWQRRAWWGSALSRTLKDRLARGDDRGLDRAVLPVDWSPLEAALSRGRGVVVVGAHIGPGGVVPWALSKRFPNTLSLIGVRGDKPHHLRVHDVIADKSRATALAAGRLALRRGGIVYVSADGGFGAQCSELEALGFAVRIGEGAPTLSRLCGAPTVPACALWQGARIRVELAAPILPVAAEPAVWRREWIEAYCRWLNEVDRGAEKVDLDAGDWS